MTDTLKTILNTIPDLLYILTGEGQIIPFPDADQNAIRPFNKDHRGRKFITDIFAPDVAESFLKSIEKTLANGYSSLEYKHTTDITRYYYAKFSRLSQTEVVCLIRDNTEQRESEILLRDSKKKYANLIDNINAVIYEIDETGTVTYVSPSIERLSGYSPQEITGRNISVFTGQPENIRKEIMRQLAEKREIKNEYRLFKKNGEECWVRFSTKAILENGLLIAGTGTLIEITEKKKKEIELQKTEEKYRLLSDNSADVIWVLNLNQKRYGYISPSVFQLSGYTVDEVMKQDYMESLTPESAEKTSLLLQERVTDFLNNPGERKAYFDELQQICKDGSIIWIETNTSLQFAENGDLEVVGISRNVEKRKQAEQKLIRYADELKLSEEKFSGIFKLNPVAMAISDPATRNIIDINNQFYKTLGFNKEDLTGKDAMELDLFNVENQREKIKMIMAERQHVTDFESTLKSKSGELLHFLISTDSISIDRNEYWLASAVNVSAMKEKENEIRQLLNQQKLLADISQQLNLHINIGANLDFVVKLIGNHTNAGRIYIVENQTNDLQSAKIHEWCNEDINPRIDSTGDLSFDKNPSWKKILVNDGHIISNDIATLPDDISTFLKLHDIKSILASPLYADGIPNGYISFEECKDKRTWSAGEINLIKSISVIISNAIDRKKNFESLANSELRLKLAIDCAKEGIWEWNMETGDLIINDTFYLTTGFEPGEIPSDQASWEMLIHPDDIQSIHNITKKAIDPGFNYFEIIYRLRSKDGSWRWILDHGRIIERNNNNIPVRSIGTRIDITEQKLSEKKYLDLLRTQDKLFTIIANDLRGPIGSFSQGLDMLTGSRILDDNTRNKLIAELNKASRNTFSLLENLLTLSRSQTGSLKIEPFLFRIKEPVDRNINLIAENTSEKNIKVISNINDNQTVFADINSVELIIRNILSNAVKFTSFNGVIEIHASEKDNFLELVVSDNGVGMKKEFVENLFSSKDYGSSFGTNKEKGTGIGLAITKDLLERNGGSIRVESREGKGSSFILNIPSRQVK